MTYRVVFSPEAEEQLIDLYRYIAKAASPSVAARYIEAIVSHCESLNIFPLRGTPRGDVRPDLRITTYKKQAVDRKACEPDYTSHYPPPGFEGPMALRGCGQSPLISNFFNEE